MCDVSRSSISTWFTEGDGADVKGRASWVQLDLPRPISTTRRRAFLRELRTRYGEK